MSDITKETIQEIAALVRQAGTVQFPDERGGVPFVITPNGVIHGLGDLIYNDHNPRPERVKANVTVDDVPSFVAYFKQFADSHSRIFADERNRRVGAVLDYHEGGAADKARWGQHKLVLALRHSEEWNAWFGKNNKPFSQTDFAEFLEQNSIDIVKPAPAAIIEVARDLQATKEVQFGSAQRMADGSVSLRYTEETKATVGGNRITVPDRFTIEIPVFVAGERVQIEVLLRWRTKESALTVWYTMVRPEECIRHAFMGTRNAIAEELEREVINGVPA